MSFSKMNIAIANSVVRDETSRSRKIIERKRDGLSTPAMFACKDKIARHINVR